MKKIGLIILGSFMLLSSTALSCPDKNFHNKAASIIKTLDDTVSIKVDTMYLNTREVVMLAMITYPNNKEKELAFVRGIINILSIYCENHDLKLET